jgi:hypothetical protein|tara:strand:+ start:705 stop:1676 length:972 start_codon:yes stop_codon:yes gene_type:complete
MQKSNSPKGQNNEPIWFTKDDPTKIVRPNEDTYQTIKQNKVEGDTNVTEINIGSASPYKIMVCTPCHSDVSMHYTQAVLKFQQACMQRNIMVSFTLLKSSLVTQGRNLCVASMLNDEKDVYTHLLFIDSDIDFNADTIFKMLEFDKDIISCPYPMKMLSWDKMWRRWHEKEDAVETADDLAKSGFTFPVKVDDPNSIFSSKGLIELTHAPTGCMLIKREVLEKMIKEYPELEIYQPTIINGKEVKQPNMYNLFDTLHDPKTKRYFGEDFGFCQRWADIGGKVYAYINDYITHVGEYQFCGRFRDDLWQGARPLKSVDDTKKIK